MTKGSGPNPETKENKYLDYRGIGLSKVLTVLPSQATGESVLGSKPSLKSKRKTSKSSRSNNCTGKKKKHGAGKSQTAPSLSVLQHKLSSNLAVLVPLLERSCPNNLLHIESLKVGEQASPTVPVLPFTSSKLINQLATEIKKTERLDKLKRKKCTSLLEIVSSSNLIERNKKNVLSNVERNCSSPNLLSVPCSRALASEFPEVVRFYRNDSERPGVGNLAKSGLSLTSLGIPAKSTQLHYHRNKTILDYLKNCETNSAPNTPPSHQSISVQAPLCNQPTSAKRTFLFYTGLETSPRAVPKLVAANSLSHIPLSDYDTTDLLSSLEKAMNVKNNYQVSMAKRNNVQSQLSFQAPRRNSKINTFSSSFCLPYGLGKRVQSSPVSTTPVPHSSSFHSGPLESLQLMSENQQRAARQQARFSGSPRPQRKYIDRQKMKILKPLNVSKTQGNITKLYDISTSEFSAAILPDPGTTSYRLTHDVSFDEGSRYGSMGHNGEIHMMKGKEDSRAHLGSNNISLKYEGKNTTLHHLNNSNNNVASKETVPLSLIRLEEGSDLPLAASSSSPVMSSAIAASTGSSFIPPPSASRSQQQNQTGTLASGNMIATFRFHKEKQNWNYRLGDLSINGGGYYTSSSMPAMAKQENNSVGPLSVGQMNNTVSQRNTQTRERTSTTAKSRLSSRFSYKTENPTGTQGSKEYSFQDPCITAPPSFQQRLTDLSLLESETLKYERNRKLRRKKNQDKDP